MALALLPLPSAVRASEEESMSDAQLRETGQDRERQRDRIAWEALERALDHVAPGHPAEWHIRQALAAMEVRWRKRHAGQPEPARAARHSSD
jgi:hypothetical protein